MLVVVQQVLGEPLGILRGQAFDPFELQLDELPADLNLRRAAR
jgi:hypothetical protein